MSHLIEGNLYKDLFVTREDKPPRYCDKAPLNPIVSQFPVTEQQINCPSEEETEFLQVSANLLLQKISIEREKSFCKGPNVLKGNKLCGKNRLYLNQMHRILMHPSQLLQVSNLEKFGKALLLLRSPKRKSVPLMKKFPVQSN